MPEQKTVLAKPVFIEIDPRGQMVFQSSHGAPVFYDERRDEAGYLVAPRPAILNIRDLTMGDGKPIHRYGYHSDPHRIHRSLAFY